jgi:predicted helicase
MSLAWKLKKKNKKTEVLYADLIGSREFKSEVLAEKAVSNLEMKDIHPRTPYYFLRDFDHSKVELYYHGVNVEDFFTLSSSGSISAKDRINYSFSKSETEEKINFLINNHDVAIRKEFGIKEKDARDWTIPTAKADAEKNFGKVPLTQNLYRPFDQRWTLYTGQSRGLYASPQKQISSHIRGVDGPALIVTKVNRGKSSGYALCTSSVFDFHIFDTVGDSSSAFPLYLYPTEQDLDQSRRVNFDPKLYARLQTLATHPAHGTGDTTATFHAAYAKNCAGAHAAHGTDKPRELVDQLARAHDQRSDTGADQRAAQDNERRGEATDREGRRRHARHPAAR